ncbi:unnamed protein product [Phyllotreta striolata]|uniref:Uncharacterized protein n=1 Tax=Phyllotreta striolata TaxID=444603 RepID=A0A9N9TKV7_PHYSR|nr:unnamed protein product [Phyllotreta striolata]
MDAALENVLKDCVEQKEKMEAALEEAVTATTHQEVNAGLDLFKPREPKEPAKVEKDSPPNVLETFGKIARNPFNVGKKDDELDNEKQDQKDKPGLFDLFKNKDEEIKEKPPDEIQTNVKEEEKPPQDNNNIFNILNKTNDNIFDPFHLKDQIESIQDAVKKANSQNIFETIHIQMEEIKDTLIDPLHLKDTIEHIQDTVKNTNEGEKLIENVQKKMQDVKENLLDPLHLKNKIENLQDTVKSTNESGNIFDNMNKKMQEIQVKLPDPLHLKDKIENIQDKAKNTTEGGNIFENIHNKMQEFHDNLPDPLHLKDKIEEVKDKLKINNDSGNIFENIHNKIEEFKENLPDPLNLKDKIEDVKDKLKINNEGGNIFDNIQNKMEEIKDNLPDPLNLKDTIEDFQDNMKKIVDVNNILPDPLKLKGNIQLTKDLVKNIDENNKKIIAALPDPLGLKSKLPDVGKAFAEQGVAGGFSAIGKSFQIILSEITKVAKPGPHQTVFLGNLMIQLNVLKEAYKEHVAITITKNREWLIIAALISALRNLDAEAVKKCLEEFKKDEPKYKEKLAKGIARNATWPIRTAFDLPAESDSTNPSLLLQPETPYLTLALADMELSSVVSLLLLFMAQDLLCAPSTVLMKILWTVLKSAILSYCPPLAIVLK